MVLATDRFLHERLLEQSPIYREGIIIDHLDLGSFRFLIQIHAKLHQFHSTRDTFFMNRCLKSSETRGPPSRLTSILGGVGTPSAAKTRCTSLLSHNNFCVGKSLTQKGFLNSTYSIALSSGKPLEKKEMRKSHEGQDSMGSSRMTLSPKMTVSKSWVAINLLRTLRQGFERA